MEKALLLRFGGDTAETTAIFTAGIIDSGGSIRQPRLLRRALQINCFKASLLSIGTSLFGTRVFTQAEAKTAAKKSGVNASLEGWDEGQGL